MWSLDESKQHYCCGIKFTSEERLLVLENISQYCYHYFGFMFFIFYFINASIPVALVGSNREFILKALTGSTILPSVFSVVREAEVRGRGRWLKEDGPGQERPWNPNRGDRHHLDPMWRRSARGIRLSPLYLLIRDTFIHQQITLPQDYCQILGYTHLLD